MDNSENINRIINFWFDKATRSIIAAENELKNGNKDFCANRIYYAAFYAVSAARLTL